VSSTHGLHLLCAPDDSSILRRQEKAAERTLGGPQFITVIGSSACAVA
jgi:hypothetical protein